MVAVHQVRLTLNMHVPWDLAPWLWALDPVKIIGCCVNIW